MHACQCHSRPPVLVTVQSERTVQDALKAGLPLDDLLERECSHCVATVFISREVHERVQRYAEKKRTVADYLSEKCGRFENW